jgi:hypothetical protein
MTTAAGTTLGAYEIVGNTAKKGDAKDAYRKLQSVGIMARSRGQTI